MIETKKRGRLPSWRPLSKQLHLLLDDSTWQRLQILTERDGQQNASATLRRLIQDEWTRLFRPQD